eukprot:TRINITY_DN8027_c0_g1_i1.p1 TRINITY_DN8027_c0_g1~~TRINITY_DN8027_c0_g1_i1.p1  ORF type:complete len:194 (-),score=37.84 TRINITY_DN8027_c0_g1_i1:183-764(-)
MGCFDSKEGQSAPLKIEKEHTTFKVILYGQTGVGKTSLWIQTTCGGFDPETSTTIGVDFKDKTVQHEGEIIKLQLWDTAGQEKFRAITGHYVTGSHAIIYIFDVTQPETLTEINFWLSARGGKVRKNALKVLVGNKSDQTRVVDEDEATQFAEKNGMIYFETSAKTASNIEEMFRHIAVELKTRADNGMFDEE